MLQKQRLVVPSVQAAEVARNTSDVDVDHPLFDVQAGVNSLPDVPLP